MAINGTVQATGEFAPTATGDTYAIIDAKYMRDGLRNVDLITDLDNITEDRRIAGMLVGVSGGTIYYKLNPTPWAYDFTDWTEFTTGGSGVEYWTSGSTGTNSLKTVNGGSDATGNYSIAAGFNSNAIGKYSIAAGFYHNVTGPYGLVIGGNSNSVGGELSAIIGGSGNVVMSGRVASFISGGQNNNISGGSLSTIVGGYYNTNGGSRGVIIGGGYNITTSNYSTVINGTRNVVSGYGNYATILGGTYNRINGNSYYGAIIGGTNNYLNTHGSVIIGGAGISGLTANTVYVPSLNINSSLINDNSLTQVLVRSADGTIKYKTASSFTFTGNTSGNCISSLYVSDIYGCSPVTIHGATSGSSFDSFIIKNSANTSLFRVRDDGYTEIAKNGSQVILGDGTNNYLDYYQNRLIQFSNSATYTGFHANRNGSGIALRATSANDISLIDSTGTMTFSTGWDNNFNNGGTLAMLINNSQNIGIGLPTNLTIPSARLHVRSTGTTSATAVQIWQNGTPTEIARVTDDGGIGIGISTLTGGFANAARLRVDATVTDDYTSSVVFDQTYGNTSNNSNSPSTLFTRLYKATTGSTGDMKAASLQTRNDGTGGMNYLYGSESMIWNIGNATIGSAFGVSARAQIQAGTITNYGGVDISYQEIGNITAISNMIGVLVRTPVNVSFTGTPITNTYGMLIQSNPYGINNYGVYQDGTGTTNYFGGKLGIGATVPTNDLHINGTTGSTQFRLEKSYTPTGSGDTAGNVGSIAWDNNYLYTKTNTGWGRVAWDYAF